MPHFFKSYCVVSDVFNWTIFVSDGEEQGVWYHHCAGLSVCVCAFSLLNF